MHKKSRMLKKLIGGVLLFLCLMWLYCPELPAVTRSIGYPFEGHLENGIPFPREFRGYQLRSVEHTYTTPEVIGALLDAIEGVRQDFPDTCDIYLGDFSRPGGGPWYPVHKSHQNGRDVDIGMYAKGNQMLNTLVPMGEENLDLPKNWSLILHLLNSHLVERIFVDVSIQRLLYNYALSQGYDKNFLDKIFQAGSGEYDYTFVRHEPNHRDHMHIRFVAPWSELAGRIDNPSPEQTRIIELAQSSFLPKKVLYYAKDEGSPEVLSSKLGIPLEDILRWNRLKRLDVIRPGMPVVFYKRGFDLESVQLALSLDALLMRSRNKEDLALLHDNVILNIPSMQSVVSVFRIKSEENNNDGSPRQQVATGSQPANRIKSYSPPVFHVVKTGDTLASIAKKYNVSTKDLASLNNFSSKVVLRPGQKLIVSPGKRERTTSVGLIALNKTSVEKLKSSSVSSASRNAKVIQNNRANGLSSGKQTNSSGNKNTVSGSVTKTKQSRNGGAVTNAKATSSQHSVNQIQKKTSTPLVSKPQQQSQVKMGMKKK